MQFAISVGASGRHPGQRQGARTAAPGDRAGPHQTVDDGDIVRERTARRPSGLDRGKAHVVEAADPDGLTIQAGAAAKPRVSRRAGM